MKATLVMGAFVASLAAWCGAAAADEGEAPGRGRRVRVTAPALAGPPVVGDLIAIDTTNVTIRSAGSAEVVAIPRAEVTRFEVSAKRRQRGRSAGIGALIGLGVGAAAGFAAGDDCGAPDAPSIVCFPRPASAAGVGLVGAGLGAVVGMLVAPGETVWKTVDPVGMRISVMPSPSGSGGVSLALSLSF
jgi:hypothetical protein